MLAISYNDRHRLWLPQQQGFWEVNCTNVWDWNLKNAPPMSFDLTDSPVQTILTLTFKRENNKFASCSGVGVLGLLGEKKCYNKREQ